MFRLYIFYSIINNFIPLFRVSYGRGIYVMHIVCELLIYVNFQTFKDEESKIARKILYILIVWEFVLAALDIIIYGIIDVDIER